MRHPPSAVMQWTLVDGLAVYLEVLKEDARAQYRSDVMVWATLAPHQKKPSPPPEPPAILR